MADARVSKRGSGSVAGFRGRAGARPAVPVLAPLLASLLGGGPGSFARADEAGPQLARANQLIGEGKLAEACVELEAAYAASRDPQLQLRLGRLYERLGRLPEARAAFLRFLDEAKAPHPALREEAQRALRTLPAPPPEQPAGPVLPPGSFGSSPQIVVRELVVHPVTFADRRSPRLWKAGAALFFGAYVPTLAAAAIMAPFLGQPDAPSATATYTLMVPALGPLISAVAAPASRPGPPYGPSIVGWSVPWLLTSGLLQAAGLTLIIVGATPRRTAARLELSPQPSGVLLSGRF
ncbi:MAG: hypothetical protein U1A78_04160 [Polyangia bacterium]